MVLLNQNKISENDATEQYDDMLNEMFPLDGIACNCFSVLLEAGDPTAYNCGFTDWLDAGGLELED